MACNFYYAAYSYLDEWMSKDSHFHETLALERRREISTETGTKCLVEVAKYYGVIRTLRALENTKEQFRLETAYNALLRIESLQESDVLEKVDALTTTLEELYGVRAQSASSKFLWMVFRSPVIIYDSLASKWLSDNGGYKYDSYANYYKIWMDKYQEYEENIRAACAELMAIKKFTRAWNVPDGKISEWIASRWFMQRVFDHFIINADSFEDAHGYIT